MIILRIIPTMNPRAGGPPQGIRNITPELETLGLRTKIITFDDPSSDYLAKEKLNISAIGPARYPIKFIKSFNTKCIEAFKKADIILIHGLWLYHSYASLKLYKKVKKVNLNCKIYILPHGMLDPWFQKSKTRKFKAVRNSIYWHLIEKKVVNRADGVLFTCQRELELARESFKGYMPKMQVNIGYGILKPYVKDLLFIERKFSQRYILFLSRIHFKKGLDLLLKAYMSCLETLNLPDLVIAGPGENTRYGQSIKDYVHQHSILNNKVHFVGMVKGTEKWSLIQNSDLFVLPSHQENFGIAVVEALACGVPVIISDRVNIYKEILNAKAGMVTSLSINDISKSLSGFFSLPEDQKSQYSKNAKEVFEKKFNVRSTAKVFSNFMKS